MTLLRLTDRDRRGLESWIYPAVREVLCERSPGADAVLPATYDDASPEERASIDRAVGALVAELCGSSAGEGCHALL